MSSEPSPLPGPGTSDGLTLPLPPSEATTLPPVVNAAASPARAAVPGYEVLAELGRGGMGVVYQARQLRCLFVRPVTLPRIGVSHPLS